MSTLRYITHLCALAAIFLMLAASSAHAQPVVHVVTEAWPPYVYEENGVPKGFDYEITREILQGSGFEMRLSFYPWKRCLEMMRNGQADALLDAGINDERLQYMAFPAEPLSSSQTVFFHPVDKPFVFNSYEDLTGLTIGTQLGYYHAKQFMESDEFTRVPARSLENGFKMLLAGNVDLTAANRHFGLYTAHAMGISDQIGYTDKPLSGGDNYMAFSRAGNHPNLAHAFSEALKKYKTTPRYLEILARYGLKPEMLGN